MKYHIAIDLSEERLIQLRIVAIRLGMPIRKLMAQIVEEYLVSSKVAQGITKQYNLEENK